jgi:hypothetical protein
MKLSLMVGVLATALGAGACGGNGTLSTGQCDPRDPYCRGGSYGGGTSVPVSGAGADSGATVYEAGSAEAGDNEDDDAGVVVIGSSGGASSSSSGGSGGTGSSSSSSGGGSAADASTGASLCVPGNACGGLWECSDDCYSDKCCVLNCSCTDSSGNGTLNCALTCP